MTLFVLLPAFNEEDSIPALVPKIFAALGSTGVAFRVVLVDDGSRDRTAERVRELQPRCPVEVITHPINRGLGETIRDGIEYCVREGGPGDIIVRLDCDDSQDPAYIPALVAKILEGHDVVITSRYQPGGGQTGLYGYRKLLSRSAGIFMKVMFPIRGVYDYSSGYRAYCWEILDQAIRVFGDRFIEQRHLGFSCTLEKVVKLHMLGARFAEVAHVLHYDQKKSVSKMASRPTTLGYLLLAWKYSPWLGFRQRYWRERIATDPNRPDVHRDKEAAPPDQSRDREGAVPPPREQPLRMPAPSASHCGAFQSRGHAVCESQPLPYGQGSDYDCSDHVGSDYQCSDRMMNPPSEAPRPCVESPAI